MTSSGRETARPNKKRRPETKLPEELGQLERLLKRHLLLYGNGVVRSQKEIAEAAAMISALGEHLTKFAQNYEVVAPLLDGFRND